MHMPDVLDPRVSSQLISPCGDSAVAHHEIALVSLHGSNRLARRNLNESGQKERSLLKSSRHAV